jgi:hypothetical protein
MKVYAGSTYLRHASARHTTWVSAWTRHHAMSQIKMGDGAARWHGTTRSRSSVALSMAGQSGGALDQWFEATTHTFDSDCASAADEADSATLGRPALASQEELTK